MNKILLKITIPIQLLLITTQILTGLNRGWIRAQFGREAFDYTHEIPGLVLGGLILLHVILNWGWIRNNYFGRKKKKVAADG